MNSSATSIASRADGLTARLRPGPPRASGPRAHATGAGRIQAVDGLRALAVLAVIAFHYETGLHGGFLGVDLFFAVSGFVITRLLLIETAQAGGIELRRFWFRRAKRLLPAVLTVLIAVQLWNRLGAPSSVRITANTQTLAALVYGSNWYAIFGHVDYWGASPDHEVLNHLWSLAVEEQFYLVWPLLIAAIISLPRSRRLLAVVAATGAATSYTAGSLLHTPGLPDRAYMGTDTRAGTLLLGTLLALVLTRNSPDSQGSWDHRAADRQRPYVIALASAAALTLGALWYTASIDSTALYTWQLPLAGLSATTLIGCLVSVAGRGPARTIGSRPLAGIGTISYSLYLWHWPIWVFLSVETSWTHSTRLPAAVALSLLLALLSYRLVEKPLRHSRCRKRHFAIGATGVVLLLIFSVCCLQPQPAERETGIVITDS